MLAGRVLHEPVNLGKGWAGFDYQSAFGKPTKVINDAAMQALGSYQGGRMLFLGLGTGLGSTMIVDGIIEPMELGHLPFRKATFEDYVGGRGHARLGDKRWRKAVLETIEVLVAALEPEYVVLGGGSAERVGELPPNCGSARTRTRSAADFASGSMPSRGPRRPRDGSRGPAGQQLVTTVWSVGLAVVLVAVTFGWTGGKQLVRQSYGEARARASRHGASLDPDD